MPYYYDLLVNLDDELWEYYEWEKNDNLLLFKKVPFIRVNELIMKDFLEYQVSLDKEWITPYINKAVLKNNKKMLACDRRVTIVLYICIQVRAKQVYFYEKIRIAKKY